ncbi:hypothetical protein pb186bvf_005050 [Paramecium bursaria]
MFVVQYRIITIFCRYNQQQCLYLDTNSMEQLEIGQIKLFNQFWRHSYANKYIEQCKTENCLGGWRPGDDSCQIGYIGALCWECHVQNIRGQGNFGRNNIQCSICDFNYTIYLKGVVLFMFQSLLIYASYYQNQQLSSQYFLLKISKRNFIEILLRQGVDQRTILLKLYYHYLYTLYLLKDITIIFLNYGFQITLNGSTRRDNRRGVLIQEKITHLQKSGAESHKTFLIIRNKMITQTIKLQLNSEVFRKILQLLIKKLKFLIVVLIKKLLSIIKLDSLIKRIILLFKVIESEQKSVKTQNLKIQIKDNSCVYEWIDIFQIGIIHLYYVLTQMFQDQIFDFSLDAVNNRSFIAVAQFDCLINRIVKYPIQYTQLLLKIIFLLFIIYYLCNNNLFCCYQSIESASDIIKFNQIGLKNQIFQHILDSREFKCLIFQLKSLVLSIQINYTIDDHFCHHKSYIIFILIQQFISSRLPLILQFQILKTIYKILIICSNLILLKIYLKHFLHSLNILIKIFAMFKQTHKFINLQNYKKQILFCTFKVRQKEIKFSLVVYRRECQIQIISTYFFRGLNVIDLEEITILIKIKLTSVYLIQLRYQVPQMSGFVFLYWNCIFQQILHKFFKSFQSIKKSNINETLINLRRKLDDFETQAITHLTNLVNNLKQKLNFSKLMKNSFLNKKLTSYSDLEKQTIQFLTFFELYDGGIQLKRLQASSIYPMIQDELNKFCEDLNNFWKQEDYIGPQQRGFMPEKDFLTDKFSLQQQLDKKPSAKFSLQQQLDQFSFSKDYCSQQIKLISPKCVRKIGINKSNDVVCLSNPLKLYLKQSFVFKINPQRLYQNRNINFLINLSQQFLVWVIELNRSWNLYGPEQQSSLQQLLLQTNRITVISVQDHGYYQSYVKFCDISCQTVQIAAKLDTIIKGLCGQYPPEFYWLRIFDEKIFHIRKMLSQTILLKTQTYTLHLYFYLCQLKPQKCRNRFYNEF